MNEPLNVLIVEDEVSAAKNLQFLINEINSSINVLAVIESVEDAIIWLENNAEEVKLAFFDIQLSDGLSFEILDQREVLFPIIFTTAYDEYAIKAFKTNSIDYLLKPINEKDLRFSLEQFYKQQKKENSNLEKNLIQKLIDGVKKKKSFTTFLIHYKDKLVPVLINDFAYFFIKTGVVYGVTFKNQSYTLDYKLDDLEQSIDKDLFFRANRQYIINRKAIREVEFYFNGRLLIVLQHKTEDHVLISKARVPVFRSWMKGV